MAARANCAKLILLYLGSQFFTELLLSVEQNTNLDQHALTYSALLGQLFTELFLSIEQNINLDQNAALTGLFCFTWVVTSLPSCYYLSSRILNNLTLICG